LNVLDLANTHNGVKLVRIGEKLGCCSILPNKMEFPEKHEETEYSRAETGIGSVQDKCVDPFFLFRYDPKNLFIHSTGTTDLLYRNFSVQMQL
jgi:hypothetical protein